MKFKQKQGFAKVEDTHSSLETTRNFWGLSFEKKGYTDFFAYMDFQFDGSGKSHDN